MLDLVWRSRSFTFYCVGRQRSGDMASTKS